MAVDSPECNCRSEVVRAVEIGNHHFIHPNSRLRWKSLLPRRQVGGFCVTFCRNFMEPGATSEGGCEAQSPGLTTARTLPAKHVQLNCRNTAASCLQPFTNWPGGEKVVSRRQYSRHEICHEHRSPGRFSTKNPPGVQSDKKRWTSTVPEMHTFQYLPAGRRGAKRP
jgi:hypothetical protein